MLKTGNGDGEKWKHLGRGITWKHGGVKMRTVKGMPSNRRKKLAGAPEHDRFVKDADEKAIIASNAGHCTPGQDQLLRR
jgi:hypothetical protein